MIVTLDKLLQAIPQLMEIEKSFMMSKSGPDVHDVMRAGQSSIFIQLGLENKDLMAQGFTEYTKTMNAFKTDMNTLISRYERGLINTSQAMRGWRDLTKNNYLKMFNAGTKAVGNPYYRDMGLTRKDQAFIGKARRAEANYFKRFLHDIKDPLHGAPKGTPGGRPKVHSYQKRAEYYAKSGKAQFYNGMVAGAGDKLLITWVLGVPQTEHCDRCPVLAARQYTWSTLPTTPRAGDTPCLFNCYCHLEFKVNKNAKPFGGDPDKGLAGLKYMDMGLGGTDPVSRYPGNITRKDGKPWNEDPDISNTHDRLTGEMNKARQMIEISQKEALRTWLNIRKNLNAELIGLQKLFPELNFLPAHSVGNLVKTIQSAARKGGSLVNLPALQIGDEILFVRGVTAQVGMIIRNGSGLGIKFSDGTVVYPNADRDIYFMMSRGVVRPPVPAAGPVLVPKLTAKDTPVKRQDLKDSFKPANTVAEAEAFAQQNFANKVDYFDFTLEQANAMNKALWRWKTNFKWGQDKIEELFSMARNTASQRHNYWGVTAKGASNAYAITQKYGTLDLDAIAVGNKVHHNFTIDGVTRKHESLVRSLQRKIERNNKFLKEAPAGSFMRTILTASNVGLKQDLVKAGINHKALIVNLNKAKAGETFIRRHSGFNYPDTMDDMMECVVGHEAGHVMHRWYGTEVRQFINNQMRKYNETSTYGLLKKISPTERWRSEQLTSEQISEHMAETFTLFMRGKWNVLDTETIDFWKKFLHKADSFGG